MAATIPLTFRVKARPVRPLQWLDLAQDRLAPRSPLQRRRRNFLPLPAAPSFRAQQENLAFAVSPSGAPSIVLGPPIAIEAARGGLEAQKFKEKDNGHHR
ncbi:hypothetical protein [Pelagibacterium lacus]|uniref:hypothetical protein n=1 Tax=Pelagibacterium lacus TaxID=2282655 RepID=UPI0011C07966|nr:hypothetical protein [Pelagibacterium lacus]